MRKYIFLAILLLFAAPTLAQTSREAGIPSLNSLQQGYDLLSQGSTREAIPHFLSSLSYPKFTLSDYSVFFLGKSFYSLNDYSSALSWFSQLVKRYPSSILAPEAHFLSGKSYLALGNSAKAINTFKLVIKKYPKSPLVGDCRYLIAKTLEEKKDIKNAYVAYSNLDLYHPLSPYAKLARQKIKEMKKKYRTGLPSFQPSAQALFDKGMLYWNERDYGPAATYFSKLTKEYPRSKLVGEALIMLARAELESRKVDSAISNLERASLRKSYTGRARFYLAIAYGRKGKLSKAISVLNSVVGKYPATEKADDAAYYMGYYNELLDKRPEALTAYWKVLKYYPESERTDDAIWAIGRIYYWARDYQHAYQYLSKAKKYPAGDLTPKALFFQAKSAEKLGRKAEALDLYQDLVDNFDFTYYSYRAREKLKSWGMTPREKTPFSGVEYKETIASLRSSRQNLDELAAVVEIWESANTATKEARVHLEKCKLLISLGIAKYAGDEAMAAISPSEEPLQNELGMLLQQAGEYRAGIRLVERKMKKAVIAGKADTLPPKTWKLAYPLGYFDQVKNNSAGYRLDPYLVLAVIREESRFDPQALSRSKAHGLMQIMPRTGQGIAKKLSIEPFSSDRMYEPATNIQMGTFYLSDLIKRFNGNLYLALAGYNGGPNRIGRYLNSWYGGDMNKLDIDEFIENIPILETRYYVQKVMESYFQYKRIYEKG